MKRLLLSVSCILLLCCATALAQDDPGMVAAQQAFQAGQAANQAAMQTMQDMQQATQTAIDQNNQAMMQQNAQEAQDNGPVIGITAAPSFSVKAGKVKAGTQVRLTSRTHYAVIYYTTNGWMPTTSSRRYKGPITINSTTQLQAIAIAPNLLKSGPSTAQYTVEGSQVPAPAPLALAADGVLRSGTRLHLVTASSVNSKSAHVGDSLSLKLDQDVRVGDSVVIPKGTPVEAAIITSDRGGLAGRPGDLVFEVHTLTVGGKQIELKGGETVEGPNHYGRVISTFFIPVVGLASFAWHGGDAEIKPGMSLTAAVASDTPLSAVVLNQPNEERQR